MNANEGASRVEPRLCALPKPRWSMYSLMIAKGALRHHLVVQQIVATSGRDHLLKSAVPINAYAPSSAASCEGRRGA